MVEFVRRIFAELLDPDIADLIRAGDGFGQQMRVLDRGDTDGFAGQFHLENLATPRRALDRAEQGQRRLFARCALEQLLGAEEVELAGAFAVDLEDAVAGKQAGPFAGRALNRRHDDERTRLQPDDDAEAAEFALGLALDLLEGLLVEKLAVGIERGEHAAQGRVGEFLVAGLFFVDVILPDQLHDAREEERVLVTLIHRGGGGLDRGGRDGSRVGRRGASVLPAEHAGQEHEGGQEKSQAGAGHGRESRSLPGGPQWAYAAETPITG